MVSADGGKTWVAKPGLEIGGVMASGNDAWAKPASGGGGPLAVTVAEGIPEGDEIHPLPAGPWTSKEQFITRPDWMTRTINRTKNGAIVDTWEAPPGGPLILLSWASGGVAGPLADGSYLATPWIWYGSAATTSGHRRPCCNGSVVAYISDSTGAPVSPATPVPGVPGTHWKMRSVIASKQDLERKGIPSQEGPVRPFYLL